MKRSANLASWGSAFWGSAFWGFVFWIIATWLSVSNASHAESLNTDASNANANANANAKTTYQENAHFNYDYFNYNNHDLRVGAEQFDKYLSLLTGKRVSLLVNQSSVVNYRSHETQHLLDALLARSINVVSIMSPEHGFRGNKSAGEKVNSEVDAKTGLPIHSLYGALKKPSPDMLKNVDILVFDIQDVGVRFYTYLSTLHYVIEAAFEHNIDVIVLDRPNPNIAHIDGPILEPKFSSFIGMHPIPVLHGMTLGELARMIVGEKWLDTHSRAELSVIPVANYTRSTSYSLPIAPSPNLPNDNAIRFYPTLCFFEGTAVSIGRGTDMPFQLIGHPEVKLGEHKVEIKPNAGAKKPKHNGKTIYANILNENDVASARISGLRLQPLIDVYRKMNEAQKTFFTRPDFFDKLAGNSSLRKAIIMGSTASEIKASWQAELAQFEKQRAPYLIYPDNAASD
ncbi:MAG: hypothetical protein CL600_09595 [Alteromonas sp.]|nr:hypothetical protein [Alteromonas sp.]